MSFGHRHEHAEVLDLRRTGRGCRTWQSSMHLEGVDETDVLHVAVMDTRTPSRPIRVPVRGRGGAT